MAPRSLKARWIFPISQPPIENGVLHIENHRIVGVSTEDETAEDLGDVAILPGFVNAHTHLDLTGARGRIPPRRDFTGWLREVIASRREDVKADIEQGLRESIASGATLLCDISVGGQSWDVLKDAPIRSVVCHELIGLKKERAEQSLNAFHRWLDQIESTPNCRPGVSPHAPYSVRRSLFQSVAKMKSPVTIHLAETKEELELLANRQGPFRQFLEDVGAWCEDDLCHSPQEVLDIFADHESTLFAHGNYLTEASPKTAIVYCPRTHAAFEHEPHPLLTSENATIALGTDSLASNPDLNILAEARFLRSRCPEISPELILKMLTIHGARALGWDDEVGTFEEGKSADFVVIPISGSEDDPHDLVLKTDHAPVSVACRGWEILTVGEG